MELPFPSRQYNTVYLRQGLYNRKEDIKLTEPDTSMLKYAVAKETRMINSCCVLYFPQRAAQSITDVSSLRQVCGKLIFIHMKTPFVFCLFVCLFVCFPAGTLQKIYISSL